MDHRLFFIIGDLISNVLVGFVVGGTTWLLVDPGWNMFLAMVIMMAVGMVAALILYFPLGIFFGAMEVMVPTMFGGMLSGMVVGMWLAMSPMTLFEAAALGAAIGLLGLIIVWMLHWRLRGPVAPKGGHPE